MGEDEDLIDVGSERAALLGARMSGVLRRPAVRIGGGALVLVALVLAAVLGNDDAGHRTTAAPPTAGRSSVATPSPAAKDYVDNEYLLEVPAQDMRAVVDRCPRACVASTLIDADLTNAVVEFPGLHALAGGTVRGRSGALVLRTVEGETGTDRSGALAHLTVQPDTGRPPPLVRTVPGDGFRTVTVTDAHDGCLFTATLVVRDAKTPLAAARQWTHRTPLHCS